MSATITRPVAADRQALAATAVWKTATPEQRKLLEKDAAVVCQDMTFAEYVSALSEFATADEYLANVSLTIVKEPVTAEAAKHEQLVVALRLLVEVTTNLSAALGSDDPVVAQSRNLYVAARDKERLAASEVRRAVKSAKRHTMATTTTNVNTPPVIVAEISVAKCQAVTAKGSACSRNASVGVFCATHAKSVNETAPALAAQMVEMPVAAATTPDAAATPEPAPTVAAQAVETLEAAKPAEPTYRELQAECKRLSVSAKGSTEQLKQRIAEAKAGPIVPVPTPTEATTEPTDADKGEPAVTGGDGTAANEHLAWFAKLSVSEQQAVRDLHMQMQAPARIAA